MLINQGELKEKWLILYQDSVWEVIFVNESRCRIKQLGIDNEMDISSKSEVPILLKPEEEEENI